MFDENQEVLCILAILLFWGLSLFSPLFLIFAAMFVLYVCYEEVKNNVDDK